MNTKIIAAGALLFAVVGTVVLISSDHINLAATDPHAHDHALAVTEFVSADGSTEIAVVFADDHVDLTGLGHSDLMMQQVPAASGARYENRQANLVLWNKGDEVTVYRNEEIIFTGKHKEHAHAEEPHHEDYATSSVVHNDHEHSSDSAATSSVSGLVGPVWVWEKYQAADGSVVAPRNPSAYTLTFSTDGGVSGGTDCNGFGGSYTLTGNELEFGPFLSTQMFCEGSQEAEFQGFLSRGHLAVTLSAGELILTQEKGGGEIHFVAQ